MKKITSELINHLAKRSSFRKPITRQNLLSFFPSNLRKRVHEALDTLIAKNRVLSSAQGVTLPPPPATAFFARHPLGYGFISHSTFGSVFIPAAYTKGAQDGDTVQFLCTKISAKGPEGVIQSVLKRRRSHVACVALTPPTFAYAPAFPNQTLTVQNPPAIHERFLAKILDWGDEKHPPAVVCTKSLGPLSDSRQDGPFFCYNFTIPTSFTQTLEEQAANFAITTTSQRIDLRDQPCLTIDPDTAKDFDDAVYVQEHASGFTLYVHIADVAHYITPNSPLDQEARLRGNSTYLPAECFPMLPHTLADGLCSLQPNQERLVVTAELTFNQHGVRTNAQFYRSIIRSHARLTYGDARQFFEGKSDAYQMQLGPIQRLATQLLQQKKQRGALAFHFSELCIEYDAAKEPVTFFQEPYDFSHQVIEECMVHANAAVAEHLLQKETPAIFRCHDQPNKSNITDFLQLCHHSGLKGTNAAVLQSVFEGSTPLHQSLQTAYIRNLKMAHYSAENQGHFGLALPAYTHFTSPIRRYADLLVARALFDEKLPEDLDAVAVHISQRERNSSQAENEATRFKKLRWLAKKPQYIVTAHLDKVKKNLAIFSIPELGLDYLHTLDYPYKAHPKGNGLYAGAAHHPLFSQAQLQLASVDLARHTCSWKFLQWLPA